MYVSGHRSIYVNDTLFFLSAPPISYIYILKDKQDDEVKNKSNSKKMIIKENERTLEIKIRKGCENTKKRMEKERKEKRKKKSNNFLANVDKGNEVK